VHTDKDVITADRIIVAAGAWSIRITKQLGDRIPLETQRGYHMELPSPGIMPRIGLQSEERKFTITPMEGGLRLAGTAEFAGLDAAPDYRRARVLLDHTRIFFPDIDAADAREWMGHRPTTPDSLPVIGPSTRHENVYYAFGHGHTGLSGSAMTGRLIADLIAKRQPSIDPSPYRVSRF
jgi:glycine/D-amino acid oxidase-like deaminating enzyme